MSEWVSSRALDAVIAGPLAPCDVAANSGGAGTIEPYGRNLLNLLADGAGTNHPADQCFIGCTSQILRGRR